MSKSADVRTQRAVPAIGRIRQTRLFEAKKQADSRFWYQTCKFRRGAVYTASFG